MKYTIEKRTSRQEWSEVTIPAAEFLANADKLKPKCAPTLLFERGMIEVDELWGVNKDNRVWSSSFHSGVMGWDEQKQSYLLHRHFTETDLGQFISAVFKLDDELERILEGSRP